MLLKHSIVIYYYDITINTGYTYKSIVEDLVRCLKPELQLLTETTNYEANYTIKAR